MEPVDYEQANEDDFGKSLDPVKDQDEIERLKDNRIDQR